MDRTFVVASDDYLIDLIRQAKRRLVVVCPALSEPVARAVVARLPDEGELSTTIVMDADPEVYRLGYGTAAALDLLREAANKNMIGLHIQSGIRIGLVISDDATVVYSPVPLLIEAGSFSIEKPNAIVISAQMTEQLAAAAGAGSSSKETAQEIGLTALTPAQAKAVRDDLEANPPQPFDVARRMRVFSSRVQVVDFKVKDYRFSSRQFALPPDLLGVTDDVLRERISSRMRALDGAVGTFSIATPEGSIDVDERWLEQERKRIEDDYTFAVPGYGRVIFHTDRQCFDEEIVCFKSVLAQYHEAISLAVERSRKEVKERLIKEFLPRWLANPPKQFAQYGLVPKSEDLEAELKIRIDELIQDSISFDPPRVRVNYFNVAPESMSDANFLRALERIMHRRSVPSVLIKSLFASGDAAPAKAGLAGPP